MDIQYDGKNLTLYHYVPSQSAAYAFVALFGIGTVAHFVEMIRLRSRFFIPFIIGAICETFGYYGRAWSHDEPKSIKPFIMQSFLLLGAPPFLAATIYMALGRITNALEAEEYSMIGRRWITKIYVFIDIVVLATQIAGVGLQATPDPNVVKTGQRIVLAGLIFQLIAFVFFIYTTARIHRKCNIGPTAPLKQSWRKHFWALYIVSVAILVRSLVRAIEYGQGGSGEVASKEVYIYIFDAVPMLAIVVAFLIIHPGRLVREAKRNSKPTEMEIGFIPTPAVA